MVRQGDAWTFVDVASGRLGLPPRFLIFDRTGEGVLRIEGGQHGKVAFSVVEDIRSAEEVAEISGKAQGAALVDYSIYSLPLDQQAAFKLLLLVPIGALIVVIMRNLVGLSTSGTFMPILIAMAFMDTGLLTGLAIFVLVTGIGLLVRSYLSRLDLLLVPRISAVVIVVIGVMAAFGIIANKLGIDAGRAVTLFPVIILSWTVERLATLWEEHGARDVFRLGGGSLIVAIFAFFAMTARPIRHLVYSFPELLLVVLAIILLIGQYTGYRLLELRRFEPLAPEGA